MIVFKIISRLGKKILENDFKIIFGALSGTGLFISSYSLAKIGILISPAIEHYFIFLFAILFLFLLITSTIIYTRDWFRVFYVISSLSFFVVTLHKEFFGGGLI